jgi:hypothetical protein
MLITEIYKGQGLGNQLWCYVVTRCITLQNNYQFGIKSPENFKCSEFMDLDSGYPVIGGRGPEGGPPVELPQNITYYYRERLIRHPVSLADISTFDEDLVNIPDNTKIDGNMQDEKYILNYRDEIRCWLKVKDQFDCYDYASDDVCVINFRGGEYKSIKGVFLPQKYWDDAISYMLGINPKFNFIVITDDVKTAKKFFPNYPVNHFLIGKDYSIIKNAHYLIIANSSFAWFPAWLNERVKLCIAPKYWWAHNISDGYWACDSNLTSGWLYLDRAGKFSSYDQCALELDIYKKLHPDLYAQREITSNFLVVSSFNNELSWVSKRTQNYLIYERGEDRVKRRGVNYAKVIRSPNVGYNLYDYFTYIIDHYEALPDCVIFSKGNISPRHVSEQYFDKISNNKFFTPIIDTTRHDPVWPISGFLSDTSYIEINNSWYLGSHPVKFFYSLNEFLKFCFINPIIPKYIEFAPGANYVVPRENIVKLPKQFYENLRYLISYTSLPGEAHIVERALQTIWTSNYQISERMLGSLEDLASLPILSCRPRNLKTRLSSWYLFLRTPNVTKRLVQKYAPSSFKKFIRKFI